jgi:hypothetical protein
MSAAINTITRTQRIAARIAGFTYLFTDVTAILAELVVRSKLIVPADPVQTAANIIASHTLFATGVALELITFSGIILLAVAFYVVLKPISEGLALLGAFWRLAENTILAVMTFSSLEVLALLTGPRRLAYQHAFGIEAMQNMMRLSLNAHGDQYQVGLLFAGLGTTVFSYLLLKSRYIPRMLAGWGVFSSLLVIATVFGLIIFPTLDDIFGYWCYVPLLVFEVGTGSWLLFKGLSTAVSHADDA